MSYANCTQVTLQCPVSATTYGYRPNLAANILYVAVFGILLLSQLVLGFWKRQRWFTFAVSFGCLLETAGYVGRVLMHSNPWSQGAFDLQIICLILAPSFMAGGIYLTLKHLVLVFGPEKSRLRPRLYTWVFICCDIFSIILQAAGGGVAAGRTGSLVNSGDDILITGISFQVVTMTVCLLLALDFAYQCWRRRKEPVPADKDDAYAAYASDPGFRFYVVCTVGAFITILIRCIYRIPEMAGGWGNPLMQDEPAFLVLDGAMIAIACILLTIAHPGIWFPVMSADKVSRRSQLYASNESRSQESGFEEKI